MVHHVEQVVEGHVAPPNVRHTAKFSTKNTKDFIICFIPKRRPRMAFRTLGATAPAQSQTKVLIKLVDPRPRRDVHDSFLYRETIYTYSLGNAIYIYIFLGKILCKDLLVIPIQKLLWKFPIVLWDPFRVARDLRADWSYQP